MGEENVLGKILISAADVLISLTDLAIVVGDIILVDATVQAVKVAGRDGGSSAIICFPSWLLRLYGFSGVLRVIVAGEIGFCD